MGIFWISRFRWQRIAYFGLGVIIIGNLISSMIIDFQTLVIIRFLTGLLGHGVGFALGVAAIGRTNNPDKNFAYSVASQVIMGSITALVVPITIAKYGIAGMCVPAMIIALLTLLFVSKLSDPAKNNVQESSAATPKGILILPLIGLFIMVIWQMGVGPFFNNLVPFGLSINLKGDEIGTALFLSTGCLQNLANSHFSTTNSLSSKQINSESDGIVALKEVFDSSVEKLLLSNFS